MPDHTHLHDHHHDHDHEHGTGARGPALWQAALIAGTGAMLLFKVVSGTLPLYVHVKYTPMIAATGIVLLILALVHAWLTLRGNQGHGHDHDHDHSHGALSWRSPAMLALMVPIILGLAVPSRALGSAAIDARGFGTGGTGMRNVESLVGDNASVDTGLWTMLDWVNALIYQPDNPRLQGQPIELTGFVWRRAELAEEQFMLSRFVLSCCTADSLAIGLPVIWSESAGLTNDGWVRVRGTVGLADVMGEQEAVILATEVVPIPQPAEPYLYP